MTNVSNMHAMALKRLQVRRYQIQQELDELHVVEQYHIREYEKAVSGDFLSRVAHAALEKGAKLNTEGIVRAAARSGLIESTAEAMLIKQLLNRWLPTNPEFVRLDRSLWGLSLHFGAGSHLVPNRKNKDD